jgi:tRNA(Ile)-lysidine synthase
MGASQRATYPTATVTPLYFKTMLHDSGRAVLQAARRTAREADAPLLLAVSGGLDSMALLHAMATVARARIAAVASFDHGTGPAARAAIGHVARAAAALGLPVVAGRLPAGEVPAAGREVAWRRARYDFLRSAAAVLGARVVTAHTEDDQVETVLMRLLRGSGTRGLAGLLARSDVLRPFVGLRREALLRYARGADVRWREDPSNRSRAFLRNRVRIDLLPALRRVSPSIDLALLDAAHRAAVWRGEMDALVEAHVRPRRVGVDALAVPRAELAGLGPDSLAILWGTLAGFMGLALDRRGTQRLASFTTSNASQRGGGSIPLSGSWCLDAAHDEFILRRRPLDPEGAAPLPSRGSLRWGAFRFHVGGVAEPILGPDGMSRPCWDASLPIASGLVVRSWKAGDRLGPTTGHTRRRVKRYLTEAGVRGLDRAGWPVVVAGDEVVWIPGVRRSLAATERSGGPVRHYVCERIDR